MANPEKKYCPNVINSSDDEVQVSYFECEGAKHQLGFRYEWKVKDYSKLQQKYTNCMIETRQLVNAIAFNPYVNLSPRIHIFDLEYAREGKQSLGFMMKYYSASSFIKDIHCCARVQIVDRKGVSVFDHELFSRRFMTNGKLVREDQCVAGKYVSPSIEVAEKMSKNGAVTIVFYGAVITRSDVIDSQIIELESTLKLKAHDIHDGFYDLQHNSKASDFKVKIENHTFLLHRDILSRDSTTLQKDFQQNDLPLDYVARIRQNIEIPVFKALLQYLYTYTLSEDALENLDQLLILSYKNRIQKLRNICVTSMMKSVNLKTCATYYWTACKCNDTYLKKNLIPIINLHREKVITSPDWAKVVADKYDLLLNVNDNSHPSVTNQ